MENNSTDEKISTQDSVANKWLELPSAPAFMCIMRTIEGKPVGMPIWKTFENQENSINLNNETLSSTFLSLSKNLITLKPQTKDSENTVMRITFDQRSWSIFIPGKTTKFQIAFFVAFEENDRVEITDKNRVELTNKIVSALKHIPELMDIATGNEVANAIEPRSQLYSSIITAITKVIKKWDKKRIKYLEDEAELLRVKIREEAKMLGHEDLDEN